eukprot:CAMPEP_0172175272 /NCGR_PEP_ID=MMETSP1050-20130122/14130_1 /TAXON_ID=233186 /ORGANISM="Cryptomonas curvata, Strain CCAP979/52" /LENGTH=167 /DNA_ID=CAMNT_0012847345 /DNA_START=52 /DNA_END=552 /DNA_ORIENTATION=-
MLRHVNPAHINLARQILDSSHQSHAWTDQELKALGVPIGTRRRITSGEIVLHQNEAVQQPAGGGFVDDWGDASDEELDFSQPIAIPRPAASPNRAATNASIEARPVAALPQREASALPQRDSRGRLLQAMSASAGMSMEEAQQIGEEGLRHLQFPIGARRLLCPRPS